MTIARSLRRAAAALALLIALSPRASTEAPDTTILSIVSTSDLHGIVFPRNGLGGLSLFGGYLKNLRDARGADGAVVLVDSGDTFEGAVDSHLSEGAIVVDAYNALGYSASILGNHEFDLGAANAPGARETVGGDPRGAIKARAVQAAFPFLAANLIDEVTGRPVEWPNVQPSTLLHTNGLTIGIVGVMTIDALRATVPSNIRGLRVAPLAAAVAEQASGLRAAGAHIVIVGAHAGGGCTQFDDPDDLSSCDTTSEIFQLARDLPPGLVDVIAAGHTHDGLGHRVAGIAVIQAYSHGRSFARADLVIDRTTKRVRDVRLFAPHGVCPRMHATTGQCLSEAEAANMQPAAWYEGRPVRPDTRIAEAMAPAIQRVRELQATPLGLRVDADIVRAGDLESPLGNLFADALRARTGADVAIVNTRLGGLRADLPAGDLTFGALFDVFPFDDRLLTLRLTGRQLREMFAGEIERGRRGALAVAGVHVRAACEGGGLRVEILRPPEAPIAQDQEIAVAIMDSPAARRVLASIAPPGGFRTADDAPLVRELVEDWLRQHGGRVRAEDFLDPARPRWIVADGINTCR